MSLQESSLRVGRRASFEIKSEPNSICALTGIDKSVSFMGARNSIDLNKVNKLVLNMRRKICLLGYLVNFYGY